MHPGARVIDAETGEVLNEEMISCAAGDIGDEAIVFLPMRTTVQAVARYLAAVRAGKPVALLDPGLDNADLIKRFRTDQVHPELGLLLTTSGSTGRPKLVRLSAAAVLANAAQIADTLSITRRDVAITTLPLFYSYGMSVLHSHLLRGATVVLHRSGIMNRSFWSAVSEHSVTSLALVPHQYEMLRRLRFDPRKNPTLRALTQAGGQLRAELVSEFAQLMNSAGGEFFVMYGQTEAAPRMATMPPGRLVGKLGSVGQALPGGSFSIVDGEVVYRGPNVMMGYADSASDLIRGDEMGGVLHTGDLGRLDEEGFLFLTGRISRICKVHGVRLNLDGIERSFPVAALPGNDRIHVFVEIAGAAEVKKLHAQICEKFGLRSSTVCMRILDAIPLLPNGKVDYRALASIEPESLAEFESAAAFAAPGRGSSPPVPLGG